jgi:hypothetical protein
MPSWSPPPPASSATSDVAALRPLAWARVALGALVLVRTTPALMPFDAWFARGAPPFLGWPEPGWHAPALGWTLPPVLVQILCVARSLGAACFLLGVGTRSAGICAAACGYIVISQDPMGFMLTLHLLYLGTLILALVDSGTLCALRPAPPRAPRTSAWLVHCFVASVYVWAGATKIRGAWLDGSALALLHRAGGLTGPLADVLLATEFRRQLAAWGVLALELFLGPLLLWRRTRLPALLLAWTFHLLLEILARPDVLGLGLSALLLSFLPVRTPAQNAQSDGGQPTNA